MSEKEIQERLEELYEKKEEYENMIEDIENNSHVCSYDYHLYDELSWACSDIKKEIDELEALL